MGEDIEKNLLDLDFQKNLIIASTSIVILFTYFGGIVISFISGQIIFSSLSMVFILFLISSGILGITFYFFFRSVSKIREIPKLIKNLE